MDVITCHTNADFDTFASMIAATKLYPEARLVVPGSLEKALRDSIKGLSLTQKIEKAGDIDLHKVTRLILVDIRQAGRIGALSKLLDRDGLDIHIYDHHPPGVNDISGSHVVIRDYGSTTTILTLIIKERGLDLTPDEATLFMAGIYEDTGFLSFLSTTVKDYEASAFLLSNGADLKRVSQLLKSGLTSAEVEALSRLIETETTYSIGGIDCLVAWAEIGQFHTEAATLAHRLVEMDSPDALFLLAEEKNRVHLVIRSSVTQVNAGRIASALGGGGHASAASATLKGLTLIEAREKLISVIKKEVVPLRIAREMMSAPPITVSSGTLIKRAYEVMLNYNINAMPVVDGSVITGIITRQVLGKAIFHNLGTSPVMDYMTTDFEKVGPQTSVELIREKVFLHGQRLLPVCEKDCVVGVITRTDLLKLLQQELIEKPERHGASHSNRGLRNVMEARLPARVLTLLREAGSVAKEWGYNAYVVGGFVRDLIIRRENLDIDIVIEGDGIAFARAFGAFKGGRVRSHSRFKTATVVLPDGFHIDVATARLEYYEKPGALPTIELSSLKLDLYRRDFTINTLALALNPDRFGELIDFFGAIADIKEKSIRSMHNLSFVEDPTRILRAVRFSERFGFEIAKQTFNHIKSTLKLDIYKGLSGARLRDELQNILEEDIATPAIARLHSLGVLRLIEPKISWNAEMAQLFDRARDTLVWYRLLYRPDKIRVWLVLFLALTDALKDAALKRLSGRLCIAGRSNMAVIEGRGDGLKALKRMQKSASISNSEVYHLLEGLPVEVVLYLMEKTKDERTRRLFSDYITKLSSTETILKGDDLIKLGMKAGPKVGSVLRLLLDKRLNEEISTKEEELALVKTLLRTKAGDKREKKIRK